MNIDSYNEPISKRIKSSDDAYKISSNVHKRSQTTNNVKEENNAAMNFEYQESSEITDNKDKEMLLANNDQDDHLFPFPPDDNISDMLEGVKYDGLFPTITDRYFTAYYKLNVQNTADDICILMHSNRICMLALAPSHVVLQSDTQIMKVDFKVSNKLDRVLNKVSGKSKHGAQPLQANSNICIITCSNGKTYTIKCCIIGKLIEANEALLQNPKLLLQPPHRGGYLAIVLPNIKHLDKMKASLLTQKQYDLEMLERQGTANKTNYRNNEVTVSVAS
ncbi:protein Abitram [Hylaeus volcanicus]|uniref:protein Abitram n=1 Tax=Hylaeus volcanicus TaxID=313075 RepID=UPI0023B85569|nr:protein Abitram [Hylaeus volcanicus]